MRSYFLLVCPAVLAYALPLQGPLAFQAIHGIEVSAVRLSEPNRQFRGLVHKRSTELPSDGQLGPTENVLRERLAVTLQRLNQAITMLSMDKRSRESSPTHPQSPTGPSSSYPPSTVELAKSISHLGNYLDETLEAIAELENQKDQAASSEPLNPLKGSGPSVPEPPVAPIQGNGMLQGYLDHTMEGLAKLAANGKDPPGPTDALPVDVDDDPEMEIDERTRKIGSYLDEAMEHSKNIPKSSEPHPLMMRAYQLAGMDPLPYFVPDKIMNSWSGLSAGQLQEVTKCYARKSFKMRKTIGWTEKWLTDCTREVLTRSQAPAAPKPPHQNRVAPKQTSVGKAPPDQKAVLQPWRPIDESPPSNGKGPQSTPQAAHQANGQRPVQGQSLKGFSTKQTKKQKFEDRQKKRKNHNHRGGDFRSLIPNLADMRQVPARVMTGVARNLGNAWPTNGLPALAPPRFTPHGALSSFFSNLAAVRPAMRPGLIVSGRP